MQLHIPNRKYRLTMRSWFQRGKHSAPPLEQPILADPPQEEHEGTD